METGHLDLAPVPEYISSSDGHVSILIGVATARFRRALNYAANPGPESVAVGDFNGDGNLEPRCGKIYFSDSVSILMV